MKQSGCTEKNSSGFSFVELMVVIAILGIMSAVSVPAFLSALPEKHLKDAARNIYADLQKARLLAVMKNKKITVRFNETGEYYYIDEDEKGTVGYKEWNPGETKGNLADYGGVVYGKGGAVKDWHKDLITHVVPYQDTISFQPVGTAKSDSVYLQYQNEKTIAYAVTATNYGTVKIRRFSGSSWE